MRSAILALTAALLLAGLVPAQERVVERRDVEALVTLGFETEAIVAAIDAPDVKLALDRDDLAALAKLGAPKPLLDWIEGRLPAAETLPAPSIDDILELWQKGATEETLRRRVESGGARFDLRIEDVLRLSGAGLSTEFIAFLRERAPAPRPAPALEAPDPDEIRKMIAAGRTADEIIARIRATDARFEVTTDEVIALERDGVPMAVLREMVARRRTPEENRPAEGSAASPNAAEDAAAKPAVEAPRLERYAPRGGRFSLLAPAGFVKSERFVGRKALVQMVDDSAAEAEDLPDLELSVLVVQPREEDAARLAPATLPNVADRFMKDLEEGFRRDGVVFKPHAPRRTWIAGREAVQYMTSATTPSATSHVGGCYVLFAGDRILVISYSSRQEKAATWREALDTCARSLTLDGPGPVATVERERGEPGDLGEARTVFRIWKESLRRYDWASFASLFGDAAPKDSEQQAFVALARDLEENRRRVELGRIDIAASRITYGVFGVDGRRDGALVLQRRDEGLRLVRAD